MEELGLFRLRAPGFQRGGGEARFPGKRREGGLGLIEGWEMGKMGAKGK